MKSTFICKLSTAFLLMATVLVTTLSFAAPQQEGKAMSRSGFFNPTAPDFPIAAWKTFPKNHIPTETDFKWVKEAGFNIISEIISDSTDFKKILDATADHDLKMIIASDYTSNYKQLPKVVENLKGSPGLLGYFIKDEPKADDFQFCAVRSEIISRLDPNAIGYVNLWPATNQFSNNYGAYLDDFIDTVHPKVLSLDIYPIRKDDNGYHIYTRYYESYEIMMNKSYEYGIPWIACCASTPTPEFQWPDKTNMRFAVFTALAYGAQGICWWTYQRPDRDPDFFLAAPVQNGKRTKLWYALRDVNKEIQSLKNVFLGTAVNGVWHTGKNLQKGTKRLGTLPSPITSLTSGESGILVSHLNTDGREYVVIVTHDYENSQKVNLKGDPNHLIKRVFPDGTEKTVKWGSFTLPAGGYAIFRIK